MSVDILVRFTDVQAAALKARRENTMVPTSAFIRRAVEKALEQVIIDAEPNRRAKGIQTRQTVDPGNEGG